MIRKRQWHVKDKWKRHLALASNREISRHIPPTRLLTKPNLKKYLNRYNVVFLKPVNGSFGNNILRVTKREGVYLVQRERVVKRVPSDKIVRNINRQVRGRPYLIQKGVPLLRLHSNPIDFRLLLLKPNQKWIDMGVMGKLGTGNRVVTNFNHGGKPIQLAAALRRAGWSQEDIRRIRIQMHQLGLRVARQFSQKYKQCRRLGIDIALDTSKRMWILEVNTNPFYDLFRYHQNKVLYHRIDRYMDHIRKKQSNR